MQCPLCGGHCIQHFQDIMICMKCGYKVSALNDTKCNISGI